MKISYMAVGPFLVAALLLSYSQAVYGRSCYGSSTTPFFDLFAQAENVYLGEVEKVGIFPKGRNDFDSVAHIKITKSWKGSAKGGVDVYFKTFLDTCNLKGMKLLAGKEYVFFTKKIDGYDFSSRELGSGAKGQLEGTKGLTALDFLSKGKVSREEFNKFKKEKEVWEP